MKKTLADILPQALIERRAIPAFNISSFETLQAVFSAASEMNYPIIVETSAGEVEHMTPELMVCMCETLSKKYDVDYVLHQDRCGDFELMERLLKAGYSSIAAEFKGVTDYDEILEKSLKARELTRKYGASMEGVLEVVPVVYYSTEGIEDQKMTDADQAKKFCTLVEPDVLVVSLGTQSGGYKNVDVDYSVLERCRAALPDMPFIMHGGSFLEKSIIDKVVALGVTKININAELRYAYSNLMKKNLEAKPEEYAPYRILSGVKDEIKRVAKEKISMFGHLEITESRDESLLSEQERKESE